MSFALAPQPKHDFIVVHDIIGNQGCSIVNENHAPLQMDTDFIRSLGEFSESESAVLMGIAKSGGNFGDRLGSFFTKVWWQFDRGFPDSFRKQNFDHSAPTKDSSLPAWRDAAISLMAACSANVAWVRVTPYSSKVGKSLGLNGSPRSLTICAKNMDTAAVGVIPISRQTSPASAASWPSIRSLICSVMYQHCLAFDIRQAFRNKNMDKAE